MPIRLALAAALALVCAAPVRASGTPAAYGSLTLPIAPAALAAAVGLHRDDPSTLGIDIVRMAFASPKPADWEAVARDAVARALRAPGSAAGRIPLPLSADTWRRYILREAVPDDRLAAAIFGRRSAALVYHGLMGVDPATLAWIETNPAVLDAMVRSPGVTAVFARSLRVRDGRIVTPGEDADPVWSAIAGADPREPVAFARALFGSRGGRTAAFYDAVAHADAARQRFAIGRPADPDRVGLAQKFFEAASADSASSHIDEWPFMRTDVNAALLLRLVAVDADGRPIGPASQRLWARVFGVGGAAAAPVDAAWLARAVFGEGGGPRARLEAFLFAQRALSDPSESDERLLPAIEGFRRFPALMLTLEANGVPAAGYAAAARAAAAVSGAEDTLAVFQAGVAIVDMARRAGTLTPERSRALVASLCDAGSSRNPRETLLAWVSRTLAAALASEHADASDGIDAALLQGISGPARRPSTPIVWEGESYVADVSGTERRRIERIRAGQRERTIDEAIAASSSRDVTPLAHGLAAILYADALGEPDSQAASGGPVWRRHRFGPDAPAQGNDGVAWRLATEVFGAGGWHLVGSLLRLDVALAHLSLRRLDATSMPPPSRLSTRDRRTLAMSVVLIDPRAVGDSELPAIAAALSRGRARAASLTGGAAALDAVGRDAGLSEWRLNAARWLLSNDPGRATSLFTTLELFRLGGGTAPPAWGAAVLPLDGCLCLRMPAPGPWEELSGRASTGQLASELADVMLRSAEALAARRLPAVLLRGVAAFAMQDVIDRARPAYFDDYLPIAYAARDLDDERFDDYVAALAASGPLVPAPKTAAR